MTPVRRFQLAMWRTDIEELLGANPLNRHTLLLKYLRAATSAWRVAKFEYNSTTG